MAAPEPAPSAVPGTRRVGKTFSHTAVHADLAPGSVSFLQLLSRRFPYHSPEEWIARIRDGRATLGEPGDGPFAVVSPETIVTRGARLQYRVEDYEEPAVPIDFHEIRAEGGAHPDLALVHKPAGLPVHKTGKVFVNVLANLYRDQRGDEAWTPLNRLDVETGGIVAFARGRAALKRFSPLEAGTRWVKTYLAAVTVTADATAAPQDAFRHEGPLSEWPDHPIRSRVRVHPDGKPARTLFRTLLRAGDKALMLARPVTGRKHQIRAHLADAGFPIVGDKVYSLDGRYYLERLQGDLDAAALAALQAPHQLLHAVSLEIRDADGNGIRGADFDLPEGFRRFFPEATEEYLRDVLTREVFPGA